jgi:hypothetical protein
LYVTNVPAGTGIYKADMEYFGRLLNYKNQVVAREIEIELHSLDEAVDAFGIPSIDFIKLDVEGAELDILERGPRSVTDAAPLGILSEIRFHPEINGSRPFRSLHSYLSTRGFSLFDLQFYHQSRRGLPYPGLCDYRLPSGERFYAYTRNGQIQDGDALYFRDLLLPRNAALAAAMPPLRLLKLAALYELYSRSDCAAEIIIAFKDRIRTLIAPDHLLDLLASGMMRRRCRYQDYVAQRVRACEMSLQT